MAMPSILEDRDKRIFGELFSISFLRSGESLLQKMFFELFQNVAFRVEFSTFILERLVCCDYGRDANFLLSHIPLSVLGFNFRSLRALVRASFSVCNVRRIESWCSRS